MFLSLAIRYRITLQDGRLPEFNERRNKKTALQESIKVSTKLASPRPRRKISYNLQLQYHPVDIFPQVTMQYCISQN